MAIAALVTAYVLSIFIWESDYLSYVLFMKDIYAAYGSSMKRALTHRATLLWLLVGIVALGLRPRGRVAEVVHLLFLITTACLLIALLQRKGWRYHMYPAFVAGFFLLSVLCLSRVKQPSVGRNKRGGVGFPGSF